MVDIPLHWKLEGDVVSDNFESSDGIGISAVSSTSVPLDTTIPSTELSLAPPTIFAFDLVVHRWRRSRTTSSRIQSKSIVLFHGAPGNGKTFAAEAVAELAKKALFRIAPREIGSTIQDVQNLIKSTLSVTKGWDCILLLEQSDTYLQSRNQTDLLGHATVAEFNNLLDDYKGVIILTAVHAHPEYHAMGYRANISLEFPRRISANDLQFGSIWSWKWVDRNGGKPTESASVNIPC
ncbi:hypothetical protein PG993_002893 [Apiospora rasikravindrae]|uniref:ATPase AAA-type core domain-containing protein n=1 Tax=Apiospora rasikravindrae TaxID=990691 RepID=A0ABR1TXX2_9PEZI